MQRWLWVTKPQFWVKLRGVPLDRGRDVTWTCDKRTRRGDVALLYRVDPAKDIAHLFRVDTDHPWLDTHPTDPKRDAWWCSATLLHTFQQPLLLADLRAESRLEGWTALDFNLHALAFEIPSDVWRVLLNLAHPLDRIALRRYGGRGVEEAGPRRAAASDPIALANLAITLEQEHPQKAEALYRQAIDAGLNALVPLADLIGRERPDEAETLYRQAIDLGDRTALTNLAVLIHRDRPQEAEALYRQAIDAGDTLALVNLALLVERDRPQEAEALYRRAVNAGHSTALANLARLIERDRPQEAEALYRQAIDAGVIRPPSSGRSG